MTHLKCISIDDDPLFIRKLEAFTDDLDWITIEEDYNNPVQGATAIVSSKPDVVFMDIEMPYMDGEYLVDWLQPTLKQMENPPRIIVISSLTDPPKELLRNAAGFINKSDVDSQEHLEAKLKEILF